MKNRIISLGFTMALMLGVSIQLHHTGCAHALAAGDRDGLAANRDTELTSLHERVKVLEACLPLLACGPELRSLIQGVRKLCSEPSSSTDRTSNSPAECREQDIKVALAMAERELETKSIGTKLLRLLRHEVLYPNAEGNIVASQRLQRLATLAKERLLPSTRFLVVAGGPGAMIRIGAVQALLREYGIKDRDIVMEAEHPVTIERFERPWNLRLGVTWAQLPAVDRPVPPAESRELDRAVYVFRTDCM